MTVHPAGGRTDTQAGVVTVVICMPSTEERRRAA